jgi:hypothetical protein
MEKTKEKYRGHKAKDRHLSVVVELAWAKCTEYYRKLDDTPVYLAGVVLHPSHKWERLERLFWGGGFQAHQEMDSRRESQDEGVLGVRV